MLVIDINMINIYILDNLEMELLSSNYAQLTHNFSFAPRSLSSLRFGFGNISIRAVNRAFHKI